MQRSKSQFVRLMELDQAIRARRYPNCLTFSADYEVSQKTIQRDIDFLRDQCGAPIAYDRERKGFYYEDGAFMLPSVMLTEGELLAVLLGARALEQYRGTPVAAELERVFGKLADMLPDKVSLRPELLNSRFTFTGPAARPVDAAVWATVVRGLLSQQTLKVVYRPFEAAKSKEGKASMLQPLHIASLQGEWYVFAVHKGHADVRQFAMARIEKATLTDERFQAPSDFDAEKLVAGTFGRYAVGGMPQAVRLLFDKDVADWVTERQWHPAQKVRRRRTGEVELEFPAKGLFEVQRWVLSWGHHVRVLAPDELKAAVQEEVRLMGGGR